MKNCLIIIIVVFISIVPVYGQDFYGAEFTGAHTIGVFGKYDGKFSVGVQYNLKKFAGPFTRPVNVNLQAEIGINNGIDKIAGEVGAYQIYADGGADFKSSFGMGTGLTFRAEHCPIIVKDNSTSGKGTTVSAGISLKPGYYANQAAFATCIGANYVKFRFGCAKYGSDDTNKAQVTFFESLEVGIHTDVAAAAKGYHITLDGANSFYFNQKPKVAWNTFSDDTVEDDPENCLAPESNLNIRISTAYKF